MQAEMFEAIESKVLEIIEDKFIEKMWYELGPDVTSMRVGTCSNTIEFVRSVSFVVTDQVDNDSAVFEPINADLDYLLGESVSDGELCGEFHIDILEAYDTVFFDKIKHFLLRDNMVKFNIFGFKLKWVIEGIK